MPQFGGSVPQLIADAGNALLFDPRWREQGSKQRTCDLSTICRFCSFSSDSVPDRAASEKSGHDASCMLSTGVRRLVMSYRPTLMLSAIIVLPEKLCPHLVLRTASFDSRFLQRRWHSR